MSPFGSTTGRFSSSAVCLVLLVLMNMKILSGRGLVKLLSDVI